MAREEKRTLEFLFARCLPEPNSGCWLWSKSVDSKGYGQLTINKKIYRSHRCLWQAVYGDIPEGMLVCHKCDTRRCINPEHLFLGTQKDNMRDMCAKGRHADFSGEAGIRTKLTEVKVLEIRKKLAAGGRVCNLAREYEISSSVISGIKDRTYWKKI